MPTYDLHPPTGIGPVCIGMSREEVRQAMSEAPQLFQRHGYSGSASEAYHGGAFLVFYGGQPETVAYIEVPGNAGVRLVYGALDVFDASIEDMLEALQKTPQRNEEQAWYSFSELRLMLILPTAPKEYRTFVWGVGVGNHPTCDQDTHPTASQELPQVLVDDNSIVRAARVGECQSQPQPTSDADDTSI